MADVKIVRYVYDVFTYAHVDFLFKFINPVPKILITYDIGSWRLLSTMELCSCCGY